MSRPSPGSVSDRTRTPPDRRFDGLIFDLDGTLWDATSAVAEAWNRVLPRLKIDRRITVADIAGIMGKTHREIHHSLFPHLGEAQWERLAEDCYAEEEREILARGGRLYPGVAAGLRALRRRYPLFIVSNCQRGYIESFLAWSGLTPLFSDFESHGNTGASKADNLKALVRRNGLRSPVYIGDTGGDRQAAAASGLAFVQARYGFGVVDPHEVGFEDFSQLTAHFLGEGGSVVS